MRRNRKRSASAAYKAINFNLSDDEDICVDEPSVKAARKAINSNMSYVGVCVDEPAVKEWAGIEMQGDKVEVAEFDALRRRRNITPGEKTSDSNFCKLDQEPCQETSDDKDVDVYNGDVENACEDILREQREELGRDDCQETSDGEDAEDMYDADVEIDHRSWETQDLSDDDDVNIENNFWEKLDQGCVREPSDNEDVEDIYSDVENAFEKALREEREELDREDCQETSEDKDAEDYDEDDSTSWETQDSSDDDYVIVDDSFFEEINRERILEPSDDEDIENVYEPFGVCCSSLQHSLKTWKRPHEFPGKIMQAAKAHAEVFGMIVPVAAPPPRGSDKNSSETLGCNISNNEDLCVHVPVLDERFSSFLKRHLCNFHLKGSDKTGPEVKCNVNDDEDLHMYVLGLDKNSPSYAKISSFLAKGSAKGLADIEMAGERVADTSVKSRRTNITGGEKPHESNSNLRRDGTEECTQESSDNKNDCKNYPKLLSDENMNKVCGDSFSLIPGSSEICKMPHPLTKKTGRKVKCNENDDEDLHMHVRGLDKNSTSCAKRKLSSFLAKDSAKELAEMEMAGERVADISVKRRRTNITEGEKPHEFNSNLRRDGTEGCTQESSDNKDDCKNYLKLLPDENMNKVCEDSFSSISGSSEICKMPHPLTKKVL
ncbi:uncharacterized protein [Macrobrachium rosenbergii]|uniref:uncharacterized protein n=1 Tax=Macrobrachium rosenbergii TaxID=79674 RepID=UPI0034D459D9